VESNYWVRLDLGLELARVVLQDQQLVAHMTAEEYRIVLTQGCHNAQGQGESLQSLLDYRVSHTVVGVQGFGVYERERIRNQRWSFVVMHELYQTSNLEQLMS
jgi:hypothetical protein